MTAALPARVPTGCFIGGTWRAARSGRTFAVEDPSDSSRLAEVADGGAQDGDDALAAAADAQDDWAATAPRMRSELLRTAYQQLLAAAEDIALLITLEMGKPLAESRGEVRYAADFLRWFGEQAVRVAGEYRTSPAGDYRILTTRRPVGPCLLVTPWNFPLAMMTRKVAPALAAGCTVVLKPAEETPLTALLFAQLLQEAGLPAGVVNVVPTSDPAAVVGPLLRDSRLRKLSFTGSTEVGRLLLAQAARNVLRISMELGGNAPFVVFDDAELDAAVDGAVLAKLRNGGQSCVAANRFHVQEGIADAFTAALAKRFDQVRTGAGTTEGVDLGPMINAAQRGRVDTLVDEAIRGGAQVVTSAAELPAQGHYVAATVLADLPSGARLRDEEIFGPVAAVYRFGSEEDGIRAANASPYGLVSYVYTRGLNRAIRVAERLDSGMVGVNRGLVSNAEAPFGGVKQSGLGREGGFEGIDEYLDLKYIAVELT